MKKQSEFRIMSSKLLRRSWGGSTAEWSTQ